jgi:hypothetical protein
MPRTMQEAVRVDDLLAERRPAELRVVVAGFNGGGGPYRPLYAGHDVLYDLALYAWVHQATWRFEEHRNFWAGMRALWPPPRGVPPVRPVLVAACVVLLESHVGLSDATDFAGALGYKFATLRHYGVVAEAQRLLDLPVDARPPDATPWWFPYVYAENETPPTPPGPARAPDGIHTLLARAYRHVAERDGHELLIDQNGAAIDGRALPWAGFGVGTATGAHILVPRPGSSRGGTLPVRRPRSYAPDRARR